MRKEELLISTDDIPTVEEAVYPSDSRRAGKTSSVAWEQSHAHEQSQADALKTQRSGQDLSSKSSSASPDTL